MMWQRLEMAEVFPSLRAQQIQNTEIVMLIYEREEERQNISEHVQVN